MTEKSHFKNRLYIIDGNALLHRAWHAIPSLTTKDGTMVNAAYGFALVLDKIITEDKPTHLAVAWDVQGGTFRDDIFQDYKAHREKKGPELYDQIPIIQGILEVHGIPSFGVEGYEGDDVIGTIAEKVRKKKDTQTIIITGDLDALQLVDESTIVKFFLKGVSKTKIYDIAAVKERYGFGPEMIIDYKALRGDSSDNIPGVKGIGEKGATELIESTGGIDEIYKALRKDKLEAKDSTKKKLQADEENARMSKELATIIKDVPIEFSLKKAKLEEPNWTEVTKIYKELEFTNLLNKLNKRGIIENAPVEIKKTKIAENIVIDRDGTRIQDLLSAYKNEKETYSILVRDQPLDLLGITISMLAISNGKSAYVFISPSNKTLESLKSIIEERKFYTYDLKTTSHNLKKAGISMSQKGTDNMVACYIAREGGKKLDINLTMKELVGSGVPEMPKKFETEDDFRIFGEITAAQTAAGIEVRKRLKAKKILSLYDDIEHPLIKILEKMEDQGVTFDKKALEKLSAKLKQKILELTKQIHEDAGTTFNINSPAQLAKILFEDLELPTKGIKKNKNGYSTAAPELEKLSQEHEIIDKIKEYRELSKLQSTYVEALPKLAAIDGKIHTTYNQTITSTGRLSSSEPNLQNIPIRTELGKEVRRAFIASEGTTLVAIDYSQIELRLAAAFSKDETMLKIFKAGGDIHKATAAKIFDLSEKKVSKIQRRSAKSVNFGIIYGMGPRSLGKKIGIPYQEAQDFIEKYFEVFPGVRKYLDESLEKAQETGRAETLLGRRRKLPDLNSPIHMMKVAAERMAINMPLQGSAADILKKAMIDVDNWITTEGLENKVKMLLQVHDELVFEINDDFAEIAAAKIDQLMSETVKLPVQLILDIETGKNWRDIK